MEQSAIEPTSSYLVRLREGLVKCFNEGELQSLCFDMQVDYDSLPGQGKENKARELVSYLQRRGRLSELVETCSKIRPHFPWKESSTTLPVRGKDRSNKKDWRTENTLTETDEKDFAWIVIVSIVAAIRWMIHAASYGAVEANIGITVLKVVGGAIAIAVMSAFFAAHFVPFYVHMFYDKAIRKTWELLGGLSGAIIGGGIAATHSSFPGVLLGIFDGAVIGLVCGTVVRLIVKLLRWAIRKAIS